MYAFEDLAQAFERLAFGPERADDGPHTWTLPRTHRINVARDLLLANFALKGEHTWVACSPDSSLITKSHQLQQDWPTHLQKAAPAAIGAQPARIPSRNRGLRETSRDEMVRKRVVGRLPVGDQYPQLAWSALKKGHEFETNPR